MTSLEGFLRLIRGGYGGEDESNSNHETDSLDYSSATEPPEEGIELVTGGEFGRIGAKFRARRGNPNIINAILRQRSCAIPVHNKEDIHSNLVPNTNGTTVANYDARIYTASFSKDSSFFYTCAQDFKLHIFDMRQRPILDRHLTRKDGLLARLPVRKVIQGHPGNWTITDADLSPNNEQMIYSSIVSSTKEVVVVACDSTQTRILESNGIHDKYIARRPGVRLFEYNDVDGIWSCRFSADGKEVIAGGSGKIFVFNLLANRRTVKIDAHRDDVNSCCWADAGSGNILVSASDDTYLKVWDRRSLGATKKPTGVLIGHTEGITYVSAKGDGRYIISNGKDQALRLWDLRRMRTNAEHEAVDGNFYGIPNFDYRYSNYTRPRYKAHPQDCSVMTYRGHRVLQTLIRCHLSPTETTGAQYLYSGSADGRIHIWSLDGGVVHVLDRSKTAPFTFDPSGPDYPPTTGYARKTYCVRDVSWHTQEPLIMSAGWSRGTDIARHEYKGLSKMAYALEDWVEKNQQETLERNRRTMRLAIIRGGHADQEISEGSE